ncbi:MULTISPECIES: hypothetical protein [unclassified Nocardia]|uniref:hypothetical protein n=1 Tax=unclassified Nocardia TaxID=2637762 RepID=UPI001CE3DF87|nr:MULTISPECIES: hypothetical protein [unclassified Nocardia]
MSGTSISTAPPFPESQASVLEIAARAVGAPGIFELLNQVRDLVGHPAAVQSAIKNWIEAKAQLTLAVDGSSGSDIHVGLNSSLSNLKATWDGVGSQAAQDYVGLIISSTNDTKKVVDQVISQLVAVGDRVVRAYTDSIERINQFSDTILDYLGGSLAAVLNVNPGGAATTITNELKGFSDETTKILTTLISDLQQYVDNITNINSAAAGLNVPGPIAPSALDYHLWHQRT